MKTLTETLKALYEEVPRNWCRVRCSQQCYENIRAGAAMVTEPCDFLGHRRSDLQELQIYTDDTIKRDDVLALYDRHNVYVRSVHFVQDVITQEMTIEEALRRYPDRRDEVMAAVARTPVSWGIKG